MHKSDESSQRPRLPVNRDNQFWVDGVDRGELLIQRCSSCGELRHPPGPMCPACRSLEWATVRASGRGSIYSYTIHHKPPIPGFELPFAIVLVQLEEGTRIIGNLAETDLDRVCIGLPVEAVFAPETGGSAASLQWRIRNEAE